jgi:S1-C subfamily serine protease
VVRVGEGTGAEQAGLIPGDVIEEVRGESIADAAELMHEIGRYARGRRVRVVFTRDGSRMEVRAMLGQGQPAECPASAFWE